MNPTLEKIKKKIVDPEISKIKNAVVGYVTAVYYQKRTCDIAYIDSDGARKVTKNISFPKDGDGLYTQSLKAGDRVELAYRNQSMHNMYISSVYKKNKKQSEMSILYGQDLPISTDLF